MLTKSFNSVIAPKQAIMKTIILIISLYLSALSHAQLAGHFEVNKPTSSGANGTEWGLGLQYPLSFDCSRKIIFGANVSTRVFINQENGIQNLSIPLLALARYYSIGRHGCSGGAYLEGNVGVRYQRNFSYIQNLRSSESITAPEISAAIGFRSGRSYDFSLRFSRYFSNNSPFPFAGIRLGYTF